MKKYPAGTVRRLLETDAVTKATRTALKTRLREIENYQPQFFAPQEFEILSVICRRLIPQTQVDCAAFIDRNFSENKSDGWRYDALPGDAETFRRGFDGINETANLQLGKDFRLLNFKEQDEILTIVQNGTASGKNWKTLSPKLFFEELLAQTVEVYYAHPLAQEQIGYAGMADAPGWTRLKLNELEMREPRVFSDDE